jgi:hypothetical protein
MVAKNRHFMDEPCWDAQFLEKFSEMKSHIELVK